MKAHQHSMGASSGQHEPIGKSRGGNTTKIHLAADSYRLPIEFMLTGGEVHDSKAAPDLIEQLPDSEYTVADKGYDSKPVREQIRNKGSIPVIPRKSNSKTGKKLCQHISFGLLFNVASHVERLNYVHKKSTAPRNFTLLWICQLPF